MRERLAPDSGGATRKVGSRKSEMVAIIRGADRDQVSAVAKRHGVSEQTIYTWRKLFGGLEASDVRRLRQLEAENARLKKLVAERDLEIEVIEGSRRKKMRGAAAANRQQAGDVTVFAERARVEAPA